jgi:hypothetical protein
MSANKHAPQLVLPYIRPMLTDREEYRRRVEAARRWAGVYVALGWPVTPSCVGEHRRISSCAAPDLHPANARWHEEATTDPARLDALWQQRGAYGVIGVADEAMTVLHLPYVSWSKALAALARARVAVPLARLFRPVDGGCDRETLYAVVRPVQAPLDAELMTDGRLRLHGPYRPLPLPAADAGSRVIWASAPSQDRKLRAVGDVVAALAPLLAI